MDALVELASGLMHDINKIPGIKSHFRTGPDTVMHEATFGCDLTILIDTTPIKIDSRKGRVYHLGHIALLDSIIVEHAVRQDEPPTHKYPRRYKNRRPKLVVEYADPGSIGKVMEFVFSMARMKIGSLKGSYASSIKYHENIVAKEEKHIRDSEMRREVVSGIQEKLNSFKLEE